MPNERFDKWWMAESDKDVEIIQKVRFRMFPLATETDWKLVQKLYAYVVPGKDSLPLNIAIEILGGDSFDIEGFCEKFNKNLVRIEQRHFDGQHQKIILMRKEYKILVEQSLKPLRVALEWYFPLRKLVNSCRPPRYNFSLIEADTFFKQNKIGFLEFSRAVLPVIWVTDLITVYADKDNQLNLSIFNEVDVRTPEKWAEFFMSGYFYIPQEPTEISSVPELEDFTVFFEDQTPKREVKKKIELNLHPRIVSVASELISVGHWNAAILEIIKHFLKDVRAKAEFDGSVDDSKLMAVCFHNERGCLRLPKQEFNDDTVTSRQEGLFHMANGFVKLLRNFTAHETLRFSNIEGVDWLRSLNRLYYLLDETVYDSEFKKAETKDVG